MITPASEKGDGKEFISWAPGYWSDTAPELWNDWKWQLKNRVTTLSELEKHLQLNEEERSGVGEQELHTNFEEAFRYLEQHTEVRDVLLSGGDALIFSDDRIDKLLSRLRAIKHIEFLRIGTRVPIFLPQRITPELCAMLAKHHPLWISVHVNHLRELTSE